MKDFTNHFVSTSVFGDQDESIDISKVIYVSKHVQWLARQQGRENHHVVRNPIEGSVFNRRFKRRIRHP